jgi:hypothetical protein
MQQCLGPHFESQRDRLESQFAREEFALACLSMEMPALSNLFPADQARRIRQHKLDCVFRSSGRPKAAIDAILAYERVLAASLRDLEPPHFNVASLYYDRVGLTESVTIGGARYKAPFLLQGLGAAFATFGAGFWRHIQSEYILTE